MRARTTSAIAAALSLAACTDGGAPLTTGARLLEGRDFHDTWFWRPRSLAYTRPAASGTAGAEDLSVRELDEAEPRLALTDVQWGADPWPVVRIGNLLATGENATFAYNVDTRARGAFAFGPVVLRPDGGALAHWKYSNLSDGITAIGPLDAQRSVGGFVVRAGAFVGDDLAALGHRTEDPEGQQVLARLSPADGGVTVLVSGLPAWDPAANDVVGASCFGLTTEMCRLFQVLGCTAATPACPETGEIPCAIAYARDLPGSTPGQTYATLVVAAYDVNRAVEVPIEGRVAFDGRLLRSPDGRRVAWTEGNALNVWDACAPRAQRCEGPSDLAAEISPEAWRPDGRALRAVLGRQSLLVMSAEDGRCTLPATAAPSFAFYSEDGTKMGWLDQPFSGPDRTLWMADGLGQGAAAVASGPILDAFFSQDTRFLVVRRLHDGTGSIGVIDLRDASPSERPIAVSTAFTMALGTRRLVALTGWSNQDQSGRVELFDLVTGTSTVIAEPATTLAVAGSVDDAADIAYVLRTRVPSAFDGLWLATLPAAGAP
jgi:hypothetical protein